MEVEVLHKAVLALAAFVFILAAASDAWRYRIPNWTSLALLLLFPLFVWTSPISIPWINHIGAFAIVFAFGYALYAKRLAGAGDIKLLSVASLWAGPERLLLLFLVTALAGGLLSAVFLGLAWLRQRRAPSQEATPLWKVPVPYGVAIALGGLCALVLLSHPGLAEV